jgi:hypothetical protein
MFFSKRLLLPRVFKKFFIEKLIGAEGRDSCRISGTGETIQYRKARSGLTARPAESEPLQRKLTSFKGNTANKKPFIKITF